MGEVLLGDGGFRLLPLLRGHVRSERIHRVGNVVVEFVHREVVRRDVVHRLGSHRLLGRVFLDRLVLFGSLLHGFGLHRRSLGLLGRLLRRHDLFRGQELLRRDVVFGEVFLGRHELLLVLRGLDLRRLLLGQVAGGYLVDMGGDGDPLPSQAVHLRKVRLGGFQNLVIIRFLLFREHLHGVLGAESP